MRRPVLRAFSQLTLETTSSGLQTRRHRGDSAVRGLAAAVAPPHHPTSPSPPPPLTPSTSPSHPTAAARGAPPPHRNPPVSPPPVGSSPPPPPPTQRFGMTIHDWLRGVTRLHYTVGGHFLVSTASPPPTAGSLPDPTAETRWVHPAVAGWVSHLRLPRPAAAVNETLPSPTQR